MSETEAKCTVLVIQLFLTNCIQAHDNCLQVLPHINLYRSTRRPRTIGCPGHVNLSLSKSCISKKSVFQGQDMFSKNRQKIIQKKIVGLRPAPTPYGAAHLPPTKVGAKCLAALVLDNQDRALCPEINALSSKCNTNTDLFTIQLQINSVIHASGALRQRERPCIQTCASAI